MRPSVVIVENNGGLNLQVPGDFGTVAILVAAPIAPVAGYSVPFLIRNKKQLATAFAQVGNEDVLSAISAGYFAEAADGVKLYVMAMAATTTMTIMLSAANADKLILFGGGSIRALAVVKFPSGAYTPTIADGFDNEVFTAVTAAQALAESWFLQKKPFRVLIEGYGYTDSTDAKDYSTENKRNVAVVVGNIDDSTAQAALLALGRISASQSQQNIGRIKSGSLKIAESSIVKIGSVLVEAVPVADLEELHAKRYITIEVNEDSAGYVFNDDNMLTSPADDYNSLRNGRVIDNATRIAYKTYFRELKDDVDADENGRLSIAIEKGLETAIETAINFQMPGQLSRRKDGSADVTCLVNPSYSTYSALYEANNISDPNFNILETETVYLFLRLRPKGCLKHLNVYLGFTS